MGATSLRVQEDIKEEFDRVQGMVQAETGDRLSQSELLARLLRFVRLHERQFLEEQGVPWRPPTPEQIERFFESLPDPGVETDASKIDEVLYGGGGD